ncbi:MAG TPA: mandelate racemase/muconate lactonizing enzyme family protein [Solirubrobacterales bacterium]|nr:mandelate racemase/muconate lactonizing enzyme family protein [Solirubrobacterales bacterium]
MRLASVEVIPYALPFKEPYVSANGTLTEREMVLLRVRDEEGRIGLGEAVPLSLRGGVTIERVVEDLRRLGDGEVLDRALARLDEEDGFDPEGDRFDGDEELSLPARCAVQTALMDLVERRQADPPPPEPRIGPTVAVVGYRHDPGPVPCNATLVAGEPSAVAEDALRWREEGFETFKVKVGVGEDVARVQALREAVGAECSIRVDANAAWSVEEAKAILAELEPFRIELVEQPVWRLEEAARLAWETTIPLAGDESIVNREDAELAARLGAYRLAGIKLSKVGGIAEGWVISAWLHSWVSSALDGPVGIAAGVRLAQRIHYEGFNPYAPRLAHGLATQRLFATTIASCECEVRDGWIHAAEGPGLGIEIDEEALQAHRL